MTKEYHTIAELWHSFHVLMRNSGQADDEEAEEQAPGLPGTGGHVVSTKQ
jgi:DASH complex subunit DAD1